jgi:ankyrin repeat protein
MVGKTSVAELLIEHGAIVDAKSNDGLTPLDVATQIGDEAMVEVLKARATGVTSAASLALGFRARGGGR